MKFGEYFFSEIELLSILRHLKLNSKFNFKTFVKYVTAELLRITFTPISSMIYLSVFGGPKTAVNFHNKYGLKMIWEMICSLIVTAYFGFQIMNF